MCKNFKVSEETLRNYNTLVKSHINEALENKSAMQFSDNQRMSNLEFHGPNTFISVLIAMFVLLGMFLLWHFFLKRCLKSNNGTDWTAHSARQAGLAIRCLENRHMEIEAMGPLGAMGAPLPERVRDVVRGDVVRENVHGPAAEHRGLPRNQL